jgi:hypothetical protein
MFTTTALEGQISTVTGNGRASIAGRAMAIDPLEALRSE